MNVGKFFKSVGPVLAMAAAAGVAGCDGMNVQMGGKEGVPLSELDLSGETPTGVALFGPDIVRISEGEDFTISVTGDQDAKDRMRFVLDDGSLGITREKNSWSNDGKATVSITMPAPASLVVAGSGQIVSEALAEDAEISIAGSGTLDTPNVAATALEVSIAGSGHYKASGTAESLELSIAGSGDGDMSGLKVDRADITIAGSGNAAFASDGDVSATIMGSGDVTVRGNARCTINSLGSGKLVCEREAAAAE